MRVGRRLVREGVLTNPDDVFFLHREEVAAALRDGLAARTSSRSVGPSTSATRRAPRPTSSGGSPRTSPLTASSTSRALRATSGLPEGHGRVGRDRAGPGAGRPVAGRLRAHPARRHHRLPVLEPVVGADLHDRRWAHHEHRRGPLARRRRRPRVRAAGGRRDGRRDDEDRRRAAGRDRRHRGHRQAPEPGSPFG